MSDFWELVKESVITQALITLLSVGTTCFLWIEGRPVPPELLTLMFTCVAFYFGSKMGFAQGSARAIRTSGDSTSVAAPSPK